MPFDPDAYLSNKSSGFNPDEYLSSKGGVDELPSQQPATEPSREALDQGILEYGFNTIAETASALNRGVVDIIDLPATLVNAASQLLGSEGRLPTLRSQELMQQSGIEGGFMPAGMAREAIRFGGEMLAPVPPVVQAFKGVKRGLSSVDDLAKESFEAVSSKLADDIPTLPPAANIPGAKSAQEVFDAAVKGGELQKFVSNPQSTEFADKVLKGGKLVADPIAKQALRQGLDEGLVSMMKTGSVETRSKMMSMLNITKRGRKDLRYADRYRPWDVAGKSMTERIKFIKGVKNQAGSEVNQAAKALAGKSVDYSPAIDSFLDELADLGVNIVRGKDGKIKPDFSKSVFRKVQKPKKIIKDIIDELDTDNLVDAREVHIAKGMIDELVSWGKGATGQLGKAEHVAKGLRKNLNNILGDSFPAYREANVKYKETLDVLEDIGKSSGVKLDINDANYAQAVGTGLRRLLSNAQSKSVLSKAADDIERLSTKHGADFKDDVRDQVSFANQLDAIFGPSAKTSLAGEMSKTAEKVVDAGGKTITGIVIEGAKAGYKAAARINEENALKSLESLLKTEY